MYRFIHKKRAKANYAQIDGKAEPLENGLMRYIDLFTQKERWPDTLRDRKRQS